MVNPVDLLLFKKWKIVLSIELLCRVGFPLRCSNDDGCAWSRSVQLDLDGAAATWDKITGRFPRDPDVLSRAADYFLRWNFPEKAHALLRRVTALEPENLQTWTMLARLGSEMLRSP